MVTGGLLWVLSAMDTAGGVIFVLLGVPGAALVVISTPAVLRHGLGRVGDRRAGLVAASAMVLGLVGYVFVLPSQYYNWDVAADTVQSWLQRAQLLLCAGLIGLAVTLHARVGRWFLRLALLVAGVVGTLVTISDPDPWIVSTWHVLVGATWTLLGAAAWRVARRPTQLDG